ncbi:hypothetical protein [Microbacterium sp. MM2322]
MDPFTSAVLAATLLAVWSYVTYIAVRRGVRDGLLDKERDAAKNAADSVR